MLSVNASIDIKTSTYQKWCIDTSGRSPTWYLAEVSLWLMAINRWHATCWYTDHHSFTTYNAVFI